MLSHRHRGVQKKNNRLANTAEMFGLKINNPKTNKMKNKVKTKDPITLGGTIIEDVPDCVSRKQNHYR